MEDAAPSDSHSLRDRASVGPFLVVAAAAALAWLGDTASVIAASPQDECRIGAVDPEHYREIKARAAGLAPVPWLEVVDAATSGPNPVLTAFLRRAIEPVGDADARLATIHAALRRGAAAFSWANGYPRQTSPDTAAVVSYIYAMDTWDMGLWRPVCRKSIAVVHVVHHASGEFEIEWAGLVVPSCFKSFGFDAMPAASCPPPPDLVVSPEGE